MTGMLDAVNDYPSQDEQDAIRNRIAAGTASQRDCYTLLRLADALKYNLFLRDVHGEQDHSLLPVRRACAVVNWLTRYQRARVLWLKRQAIRAELDTLYADDVHAQKRANRLWIQFNAITVRLARMSERMSDADVKALVEEKDEVCAK